MGKSVIATKISLALGLILAMLFGSAPVGAFAAVVRSTYIVQVQDGYAGDVRASISRLGETPHDELTDVMDGFILDLTNTEAAALRLEPYVIQVVADAPMSLMDTQSPVPSWGLDRIDQTATAGDGSYNYPSSGGAGVRVYVVDTGVMASNPDFAGRILPGVDMYGQNLEAADCQGHGTHVAGTIAGTKYGVAKKASIVPVRVLSCSGSGSWSYFISAMDWIIANNPAGTRAVMSASIGGGSYPLANAAVEKLYAAGITPVIAAGNSNIDACGTSPAGAANAITVGASEINDARASYSNWGECVDVFGPGSNIISDSNLDPTIGVAKSGTSMATPHVSGLVALYLAANPTASPAAVTAAIKAGGLSGAVVNAQSTLGNILINNTFTRASVPVAPAPVYPPTALSATAITGTGATISWTAPAVSTTATAPDSYKLEYKLTTDTVWQAQSTTATSLVLATLAPLNNYLVRVTSIAGTQVSAPSAELQFSTLGTAPDAPTNLLATAIYGNQIDLSWTRPNTNGSNITGYYLEWLVNGAWTIYATVGSSSTTVAASVKNLTALTSYSFRIKAYNTLGASLPSNVLTISTTTATPVTPSSIVISNVTGTTATANWKASAQIDPAVAITYVIRIYSRQISNYGAILGTYNATSNSYVVTGLKRTTAYSLSVTALSGSAASPTSGLYIFTTTAAKPGAPTSTKAVKTSTGFTLSWAGPADDGGSAVTGYQLESQNLDGTWSVVSNLATTVMSYSVPAPARATAANYRVAAVNAMGVGDYAAVTVSTPADLPGSPQSLTLTRGTSSSTLSWTAPIDNGGAPVIGYVVWRSADNGSTWVALSSAVTGLTYSVTLPAKGAKYLYAVSARNASGSGAKSTSVVDEMLATVSSAVRSIAFSYPVSTKLQITWTAPLDNGGSPITGYRLERQATDGSWSVLTQSNVLSFQIDRDLPGVVVNVRVSAINAIGASAALAASWRTPFVKASAPQNFTAVDNGIVVVTSWLPPTDLGGSTVANYQMQISKDAGVTWLGYATIAASSNSANVLRPAKGSTWSYRILASTGFGLSDPSNSASVSPALTVPGAPLVRSLVFATDGSMNLAWVLPSDNGGSALTAIVIEKSLDNVTWTALAPLAATATTANFARELPGVRVYFRLKAVNSIGASTTSAVLTLTTPFLRASAPQNVTVTDVTTAIDVAWRAPSDLGGSVVSLYFVQVSKDNGASWTALTSTSGNTLTARVARPAKGQTWLYRVVARTGYGDSLPSANSSISVATTVAGAPTFRSLTFNPDSTLTAIWIAPGDNGGSVITSYVVERSVDNVTWSALPALSATATSLTIPAGVAGAKTYLRVFAVNALGTSIASSTGYYMVPYLKASAPQGLTAAIASGRAVLNWQTPTSNGGSAISQYAVEYSANGGASWVIAAYSISPTATVAAAPKGQSYSYRVAARTLAGSGEYSNIATLATPTSITSSVRLNSAISSGAGTFNLTFSAPTDLGGYTSYNYRVEILVNNVWTSVASGAGAAVNVVTLTTSNRTTTFTYRVVATNPSGDSPAASFNFRG
jgi:subtilisin family serine protease